MANKREREHDSGRVTFDMPIEFTDLEWTSIIDSEQCTPEALCAWAQTYPEKVHVLNAKQTSLMEYLLDRHMVEHVRLLCDECGIALPETTSLHVAGYCKTFRIEMVDFVLDREIVNWEPVNHIVYSILNNVTDKTYDISLRCVTKLSTLVTPHYSLRWNSETSAQKRLSQELFRLNMFSVRDVYHEKSLTDSERFALLQSVDGDRLLEWCATMGPDDFSGFMSFVWAQDPVGSMIAPEFCTRLILDASQKGKVSLVKHLLQSRLFDIPSLCEKSKELSLDFVWNDSVYSVDMRSRATLMILAFLKRLDTSA